MKRIILLLVVFALTGMGAAVVGGPEASDSEMVIMDSKSSASATQAVGPNGTKWRASISNLNNSCVSGNVSEGVDFGNFTEVDGEDNLTRIKFYGVLKTSNPCHTIDLEVRNVGNVSEDGYVVELVEKSSSGMCVQCIGYARFEGSFSAPEDYKVTFKNQGEILEARETAGYSLEPEKPKDSVSILEGFSRIFSWLGSFF